ncbi:MAG: outer membrane beta-barrel protein [Flavobacteriales bacterium]|nr:outer membrane beta-barrel protein [Flavobacteriales bacterium]
MKAKAIIIACTIILFGFLETQAQTTYKGRMFVGGNLSITSLSNSTIDSTKTSSIGFSITPNYGVFVSRSFAVGAMLNYSYNSSKYESNTFAPPTYKQKQLSNVYGIAAFGRYYKFFGDKFALIVTGNVGYSYGQNSKSITGYNSVTTKTNSRSHDISVVITPGVVYFISPKFGLETSFGQVSYDYIMTKDERNSSNNGVNSNFRLNFGLTSLRFGLNYYFGKGKAKEAKATE